nr:putative capsid protein [Cressdnaviricota sp.]
MASKRKAPGSGSSSSSSKRLRLSSKFKARHPSRTMLKRKRRYKSKSRRPNNKRQWKAKKRVMKTSLSTQPYWIDSVSQTAVSNTIGGQIGIAGMAPIGVWSGASPTTNKFPYPNTADAANQYSDLTRIAAKLGIWDGSASVYLDQGQKILINYSKVQYNIRNNTNIALNLRIFQFTPRQNLTIADTEWTDFIKIMATAATDAGLVNTSGFNPLTHPTDFPLFNKRFKILKQKNVRLLPGENIFVSQLAFVNRMLSSNRLNLANMYKGQSKFFGILYNGDPVHDEGSGAYCSTSKGHIDLVTSYKLKFRRLDVPTIQNKVFLDNDMVNYAAQEHVAAFANIPNIVDS